jgi:hypothetical protein
MINSSVAFLKIFSVTRIVFLISLGILTVNFVLSGCVSGNLSGTLDNKSNLNKTDSQKTKMLEFSDIPIPKSREINLDKTMVVGTELWFGRLTFETGLSAEKMFTFYIRELTNYGWEKITAVRSQTSLMTYGRNDRIINIAIEPNRIHGSEVRITMSPREQSIIPKTPPSNILETPLNPPPLTK